MLVQNKMRNIPIDRKSLTKELLKKVHKYLGVFFFEENSPIIRKTIDLVLDYLSERGYLVFKT